MLAKRFSGDTAFALLFAAFGLYWAVHALDLPLWSGFAPDSGFLPLVFGGVLFALSAAVAVTTVIAPDAYDTREPLTKSLLVLLGLAAAAILCGFIGFALPLFGLLLYLYAWVERLPLLRSAIVSLVSTAALALVFEHWLNVPMPLWPGDL